jgi:hypothetical protein
MNLRLPLVGPLAASGFLGIPAAWYFLFICSSFFARRAKKELQEEDKVPL